MDLKQELDTILSGEKELSGQFQTDLVNALGNPALAQVLYGLVQSHVEIAKVVQQTSPGQAALAALRAKQAQARAQAAQAAPAPAAPAGVDTAAIAAQVLAQLLPLLQANAAPQPGTPPAAAGANE